jgi:hypothetical protein
MLNVATSAIVFPFLFANDRPSHNCQAPILLKLVSYILQIVVVRTGMGHYHVSLVLQSRLTRHQ